MQAVILAGGEGTRLRPITSNLPKPIIPVFGRPVMEHIIELLKRHNITEIAVPLGFMPQTIIDHFSDGSKWGVSLTYFEEDRKLGTAGCVKNCEKILGDEFVVIAGDCITNIDLTAAINAHHANQAEATIVLSNQQNPTEYGIVTLDENSKITKFYEKPDWSEIFSDRANTGIYILNKSILQYINDDEATDFSQDIFPKMLENNAKIYGYEAQGYWCDIGTPQSYKKVHTDLMFHHISPSAQIAKTAIIGNPVYIGKNAKIGENAEITANTFIGENVEIFKNTKIQNSIINKNCKIYKNVDVQDSIICENSSVGAYSSLNEAIIGRSVFIGEECSVAPNCKIWPSKIIENHSHITQNIIWGKNFSQELFGEIAIEGEINMEITPEFCAKLGAALASTLPAEAHIAVAKGIDLSAVSMLKSAFASGLISSGANVFDFGTMTLPAARTASQFYNFDGCVYINFTPDKYPLTAKIYFLEKSGGYYLRNSQRKLEQIFARADFARAHSDKIGKVGKVKNFTDFYIRRTANENKLNPTEISILSNSEIAIDTVGQVLDKIGANVYSVYNVNMPTAFIDDNGESVILYDELARKISEEQYLYLTAQLSAKFHGKRPKFAAPPYAPSSISDIADVISTKANTADFQDTLLKNNLDYQFRLMFDAAFAIAEICKYMQDTNKKLYEIVDEMPKMYFSKKTIKIDATRKAEILRKLNDAKNSVNSEGWVVVLPHKTKATVQIIAEGVTAEIADELCADIISKIK